MSQNDAPTIFHMEQALGQAAKGVEVIILGYINIRLGEPRITQEEELATVVVDCGLEDMTDHFMPRWRYRGDGHWTWRM